MTLYDEAIKRLYQSARLHKCAGQSCLSTMQKLAESLVHPEKTFRSIHIAGSNGKGSVSCKIAKALEFSGFRVGVYTSPHLDSFCERIVVDGRQISEEEVSRGLNTLFSICERNKIEANFFEMTTALAFDYFRKKEVDFGVIEVGLGGRCDATNILLPILSVITSISLEHVPILGGTLDAIAYEKGGIIKPGVPVVIGSKAQYACIRQIAAGLNCRAIACREVQGFYDEENKEIARAASTLLSESFTIPKYAIEKALNLRPPCRFERIGRAVLDVAHNPDAFRRLIQALNIYFPSCKKRFVVGICADKDSAECLSPIVAEAAHMHLVRAQSMRAAATEKLAEKLEEMGYSEFSQGETIEDTVRQALSLAEFHDEIVVICGSFLIMAEARSALLDEQNGRGEGAVQPAMSGNIPLA